MPTVEGSRDLEPVSPQHVQPYGPQPVELKRAAVLAVAVRKPVRMAEPDTSGDSEEYRKKVEVAEVGDTREHRTLRLVEVGSLRADC